MATTYSLCSTQDNSRAQTTTDLSCGRSFLGEVEDALHTVREEVPADVEELGGVEELGDFGRGEMCHLELLRSAERRHERSS